MGAFGQIVEGLRDVLRVNDEVKRSSEALRELSMFMQRLDDRLDDIDKRLVRVETMIEMAGKGKPPGRRLPRPTR